MAEQAFSELYSSLIKADISLECRNQLAAHIAKRARDLQTIKWNKILKKSQILREPLNHLKSEGWLKIHLPVADKLGSELRSLKKIGTGIKNSGNRSETEYLNNVTDLPTVKMLINNQTLFELASNYLGSPAYLYDCMAWWQYPMGKQHSPSNAQLWHRDRDDIGVLKLFFYATDVDETSGPHMFLPKSHTNAGINQIFSKEAVRDNVINGTLNKFVDDEYLHCQGLMIPWKTWIGKSGTCILEDTRAFHRASIPTHKPRLIFSLVWTIGKGFKPNTNFERPSFYLN